MAWPQNVTRADLKIVFCRGSGAGGQNRNKRDTACQMTHIPTGISVRAEDERTQEANKRLAFRRLAEKLIPLMKKAARLPPPTPEEQPGRWLRTYHGVRKVVVDHRIPSKIFTYDSVLDGDIDQIHKELRGD